MRTIILHEISTIRKDNVILCLETRSETRKTKNIELKKSKEINESFGFQLETGGSMIKVSLIINDVILAAVEIDATLKCANNEVCLVPQNGNNYKYWLKYSITVGKSVAAPKTRVERFFEKKNNEIDREQLEEECRNLAESKYDEFLKAFSPFLVKNQEYVNQILAEDEGKITLNEPKSDVS